VNKTLRSFVLVLVSALTMHAAWGQDWPQWRGPNRDGSVTGFTPPKSWPATLTQKWTATVGKGVSSPVLVDNKLYACGRIGGEEVTICLDAGSGKVVWDDKYPAGVIANAARGWSGPRSTPAAAEGKICTLGVHGVLSCFDAGSGKLLWRKETKSTLKGDFATSTSPLIAEGMCIVHVDELTAFDLAKGDIKWHCKVGDSPYGSPALMTVDGVKQVVTPSLGYVSGVSLTDGKPLWKFEVGGSSYFSTYSSPLIVGPAVIYARYNSATAGAMIAHKIEKKGDGFDASTKLWEVKDLPYQYNTPIIKEGLLYGLSAAKRFYCMDPKTGKVLWTDSVQRGESGGVVNAGSVILAVTGPAGKASGFSETNAGDMELVAFEPNSAGYKELAKYKLGPGPGLAYPVVAGNRVYIRGNDAITLWTID
jgi:outer membrane protein assembly factor BamB